MLSAKRDVSAAKRFFKKMMRSDHRRLPFTISVDKNAAYPEVFATSQHEKILPHDCKLRRVKYLNNIIEQDHRFVKITWGLCQVKRVPVSDNFAGGSQKQATVVCELYWSKPHGH
jgi:transposase-like protein